MILRLLQTPLQQAFFLLELKIAQIQRQSGQLFPGRGLRHGGRGLTERVEDNGVQLVLAVAVAIDRALDDILQFTNIPRPALAEQRCGGTFAEAGKQRQTELAAHLNGKLVGEQHDVALPFT